MMASNVELHSFICLLTATHYPAGKLAPRRSAHLLTDRDSAAQSIQKGHSPDASSSFTPSAGGTTMVPLASLLAAAAFTATATGHAAPLGLALSSATDGRTAAAAAAPCPGPKLCGTCPGLPDMNIDGSIVQMNTSEFCNICHHQHFGDDDDNQPVRALCSRRRMLEVGRRCAETGLTVSVAVVTLTKDGALFRRRCVLDRVREPVFTHHKVKRKSHHPLTRHVCHLAA